MRRAAAKEIAGLKTVVCDISNRADIERMVKGEAAIGTAPLPTESAFPMNLRWSIALWNLAFLDNARFNSSEPNYRQLG